MLKWRYFVALMARPADSRQVRKRLSSVKDETAGKGGEPLVNDFAADVLTLQVLVDSYAGS